MHLFFELGDYMINAVPKSKLKLVCHKCLFLGWQITERLNSFQILSLYLCFFCVEKVVLQICHCLNSHKFYSISADNIPRKLKFR